MITGKHEIFQQLIADFHAAPLPTLTPRALTMTAVPNKILSLTGPRRAGKTYCLYQLMQQLLHTGVAKEQLLYINFEDERLYPLSAAELKGILDVYARMYPQHSDTPIHIFFDEIQTVPGWERFVRRIHDQRRAQLYITSSSAHLLSRDLASALRGRTLTCEIFPFSFYEYLRHLQIDPSAKHSAGRARIGHAFATYATRGGYPETLTCTETVWRMILQEYLQLLIYKDIVDRYRIKNQQLIRYMIKVLLKNIAAPFSVQKVYRDLKSQGYRVGKDTLHQYLSHLEDAYSFFFIPIFSESLRVQHVNYRKVYAVDIGFVTATTHGLNERRGQILENLVYLHLRQQRGCEISYYKTGAGHEVDFVVVDRGAMTQLIQVTESLDDPATRDRELSALWAAMQELQMKTATIVTRETQEEIRQGRKTIQVVPAAQWLLKGDGV